MQKRTTKPNESAAEVTGSDASLDLEHGVYTLSDPQRIARSLKRSALESSRKKNERKKLIGYTKRELHAMM